MSEPLRHVTVERVIDADPAAIFALLSHPKRHADIDGSGTVRTARGPEQVALGDTFSMAMHRGVHYRMTNTVIEFEQDRRIAWQPFPAFPLSLVIGGRIWRYELEPVPGGTRVRETWDITRERIPGIVVRDAGTARKGMVATLARIDDLCAGRQP
jgi:hypothetical protein